MSGNRWHVCLNLRPVIMKLNFCIDVGKICVRINLTLVCINVLWVHREVSLSWDTSTLSWGSNKKASIPGQSSFGECDEATAAEE